MGSVGNSLFYNFVSGGVQTVDETEHIILNKDSNANNDNQTNNNNDNNNSNNNNEEDIETILGINMQVLFAFFCVCLLCTVGLNCVPLARSIAQNRNIKWITITQFRKNNCHTKQKTKNKKGETSEKTTKTWICRVTHVIW